MRRTRNTARKRLQDALLDRACLERADFRWSLSALTLPHGLARIVCIEQLYRAASLIDGHPYHRA